MLFLCLVNHDGYIMMMIDNCYQAPQAVASPSMAQQFLFECLTTVRGKVTRQCPQIATCEEKEVEADSNRGPAAYQPLSPYCLAKPAHFGALSVLLPDI